MDLGDHADSVQFLIRDRDGKLIDLRILYGNAAYWAMIGIDPVRRRVRRGWRADHQDACPGAEGECDRGALGRKCAPRVHGPDAGRWRAAPAPGPRRVRRSLQFAPPAPVTAAGAAHRTRASACRRCRYKRSAPGSALPDSIDDDVKVIRRDRFDGLLHECAQVA